MTDISNIPESDLPSAPINTGTRDASPQTDRSIHYNPTTKVLSVWDGQTPRGWDEYDLSEIGASGLVPHASVQRASSKSLNGLTQYVIEHTVLNFETDTAMVDLGTNNTRITITESGWYEISARASVYLDNGSTASLILRDNGSDQVWGWQNYIDANTQTTMSFTEEREFTAGDYAEIKVSFGTSQGASASLSSARLSAKKIVTS